LNLTGKKAWVTLRFLSGGGSAVPAVLAFEIMYEFFEVLRVGSQVGWAYGNFSAIVVVAVAKTLWDGLQSRPVSDVVFVWMLCPVDFY
jgi:hypothetical protein